MLYINGAQERPQSEEYSLSTFTHIVTVTRTHAHPPSRKIQIVVQTSSSNFEGISITNAQSACSLLWKSRCTKKDVGPNSVIGAILDVAGRDQRSNEPVLTLSRFVTYSLNERMAHSDSRVLSFHVFFLFHCTSQVFSTT